MTLPDERYRSLLETRKFLHELLSPSVTPKVPKVVRQRARSLLKHWPDQYHLEMMTIDMPNHFAKEMEPLYKMVKKYDVENSKKHIGYIEREEGFYKLYAPVKGEIVTQAFVLCKYCNGSIYHCMGPKSDAVCFTCYEKDSELR